MMETIQRNIILQFCNIIQTPQKAPVIRFCDTGTILRWGKTSQQRACNV